MLARLFVIIGSLVVLVLTAALVGPYFIDWTSYRSDFEREASRILGRQVKVRGEATARLLPFPSLAFTGIEVAGTRPDEPWLTVDSFSMDAELAPLLRGELLIVDMRIEGPRARLEVGEDGRIDWTLNPDLRLGPSNVALEKVTVTGGEIGLRLAVNGRQHELSDIDATLSAKSLSGPWQMQGSLRFDGRPLSLTASTGAYQPDGSIALRLQARPQTAQVTVEAEGTLQLRQAIAYAGTFRLATLSAAESAAEPFRISVEQPSMPLDYRIQGVFAFDQQRLEVSEFRLETGPAANPYMAEGSAFLDLGFEPNFTVRVDGQQMRLAEAQAGRQASMPFDQRLAALQSAIDALPHPTIPGTVQLRLPAIIAGDTTIRDVDLAAEPVAQGWRIRRFSAQLPGRSTLEADGILALGDLPEFHGNLLLAVAQPSGFAAWISEDVDDAIRRLGAAGLQARVTLSRRRQNFRELELILGEARFSGEIDHHVPADARPSMLLRLKGGALDLDGLLAFGSLFVDRSGVTRLADHDLDFEIEAGPVQAGGLTAARVDTALRLKGGQLEIDRLSVTDLAGATISATGSLHGLPERPRGMLDAAILADDLAPLARWLAEHHPAAARALSRRLAIEPRLLAEASVNLVASAATNDDGSLGLAVSAHGSASGSSFTVAGSARRNDGAFSGPVSLTASLRNDAEPARVLAALGLPALPLGMSETAEAVLSLRGDPGDSLQVEASLRGEDLRGSFSGKASARQGEIAVDGRAKLAAADIEPWLAASGLSVPGLGWGTPVDLAARLRYRGDRADVEELDGQVADARVEGRLALAGLGSQPRWTGELRLSEADLEPVLAMVAGSASTPMSGDGWKEQPFAAEPGLPFAGEVELTAAKLHLGGGHELADAKLRLIFGENSIRLDGVRARFAGGSLEGDLDFANNGGSGLLSAQFQLAGARIAAGEAGSLGVMAEIGLSGSLSASGRTFGGLVSALSGSGSLTAHRLSIRGINPEAFDGIVRLADQDGRTLNPQAAAEQALGQVRAGTFEAREASLAFTVAGGIARTPTVRLRHPGASLDAAFDIDLASGVLKGDGQLVFDAGREALAGAEPALRIALSGTVRTPRAEFDAAPLAQYLTQRALEIEQARVEDEQERLLERQRLRREARHYASIERQDTAPADTPAPEPLPAEPIMAPVMPEDSALEPLPADPFTAPEEPQDSTLQPLTAEERSAPPQILALPEMTTIIPVHRDSVVPMRLTPPAAAPAAAAPAPQPPAAPARRAEEARPQRSFFDFLFQSR